MMMMMIYSFGLVNWKWLLSVLSEATMQDLQVPTYFHKMAWSFSSQQIT